MLIVPPSSRPKRTDSAVGISLDRLRRWVRLKGRLYFPGQTAVAVANHPEFHDRGRGRQNRFPSFSSNSHDIVRRSCPDILSSRNMFLEVDATYLLRGRLPVQGQFFPESCIKKFVVGPTRNLVFDIFLRHTETPGSSN